jgi:hypothetical protein
MKRIITAAALLLVASVALADDVVYRPLSSFTIESNPSTSTAATSVPGEGVRTIRVVSTSDIFFNVGVSPNASASSTAMFIPAYTPEYLNIGAGEHIAVLSVSASGTVYITEMGQ